jgi:MFS transporter, UMF1 family
MEIKAHKRAIWAWTMYDWANSAFVTTIIAAVLPVYYSSVAAANLPPNIATAYWGYTTSIALLITAILSPILGAVADFQGAKKRF